MDEDGAKRKGQINKSETQMPGIVFESRRHVWDGLKKCAKEDFRVERYVRL